MWFDAPNLKPTPEPIPEPISKKWRWAVAGVGTTACAMLAAGLALTTPADAARLAPEGCAAVTVQRGDTAWSIARANGLTLDQVSERNPHIGNLSLIHPGDEIVISCDLADPVLAPPASVVNVDAWLGETEADGVTMSWHSVVANLYVQGMRGDDLITLAALAQCESSRVPTQVGDKDLTNSTYGPSYGFLQVRSLWEQYGTNGPRDAQALASSVSHQAWAAVEVLLSQGFRAWTCYRQGKHLPLLDTVRQAAAEMGVAQ